MNNARKFIATRHQAAGPSVWYWTYDNQVNGDLVLVPSNATGDCTIDVWGQGGQGYAYGYYCCGGGGGARIRAVGPAANIATEPGSATTDSGFFGVISNAANTKVVAQNGLTADDTSPGPGGSAAASMAFSVLPTGFTITNATSGGSGCRGDSSFGGGGGGGGGLNGDGVDGGGLVTRNPTAGGPPDGAAGGFGSDGNPVYEPTADNGGGGGGVGSAQGAPPGPGRVKIRFELTGPTPIF